MCLYWCEKARKRMYGTDCHDMTVAEKVALNPKYNNNNNNNTTRAGNFFQLLFCQSCDFKRTFTEYNHLPSRVGIVELYCSCKCTYSCSHCPSLTNIMHNILSSQWQLFNITITKQRSSFTGIWILLGKNNVQLGIRTCDPRVSSWQIAWIAMIKKSLFAI